MKFFKTILALATAAVIAGSAPAQTVHNVYGKPENFSDVVLIYAGNENRNKWNKNQLTPYVTHTYADGTEKWFFDAFLFIEFIRYRTDSSGNTVSVGFGNGMGGDVAATQDDWRWLLDEYFTTGTGYNATKLAALDVLIGEKKASLGDPGYRHKVIIVCPAPKKVGTTWPRTTWGTVDGESINLLSQANRLRAVKWYIDELVSRWQGAGYQNLDLEGIYWVEESMISNVGIIGDVNDYARSKGLRTYWIPYYCQGNETYCRNWETYKFDQAWFQPNYAFYLDEDGRTYPKSQLSYTCQGAKTYGAGLELEFETSGTSNALHSVDPAAHQRLIDYLDVFTQESVFADAGVAYYCGSRGLNDMRASTDPVDHATIDRLASIVEARIKAKYGSGSVDNSLVDRTWAYGGAGRIFTTEHARCYDLSGRLVHEGKGLFQCPAGVYILANDRGATVKLIVS